VRLVPDDFSRAGLPSGGGRARLASHCARALNSRREQRPGPSTDCRHELGG
jgi:hypothetical protein